MPINRLRAALRMALPTRAVQHCDGAGKAPRMQRRAPRTRTMVPASPSRSNRNMQDLISALIPRSIVARTTLAIIVLAALIGLVFATAAAWRLQQNERQRLEASLNELLSTVESTVRIASFVGDEALAREIVAGLMVNHTVAGVRILADGNTLYEQMRAGTVASELETLSIERPVHSPFDAGQVVGSITLHASAPALKAQAWKYTRYVLFVLAAEVLLVALSVAWVVYNLITRPIKGFSDELHRMQLHTGAQLRVPARNQKDEIGRLVGDVNALVSRLTALVDGERALRVEHEASGRRLALIFEKVDAGLFEVDSLGMLHSWNPAFVRTLGEPPDQPCLYALMPEHQARMQALIDDSLNSGQRHETDLELRVHDGHTRWAEISLTPVDRHMLQGVINDITERKRAEFAAQQLASRDTLTGLLNRRGLDAGLAAVFERRQHDPALPLALLALDLDHFKPVNDTYGHGAGDIVLQRVAEILEAVVRRTDLVARPGGDEFVVALVDIDSAGKAEQIAHNIIAQIGEPIDIGNGVEVRLGVSIGIAMAVASDQTADPVLRRADEAMYAAKQAGRGRAQVAPLPVA
jgi:diguanylate cyclase (GGDEF)-like protein/PAS domain S-box-containing protein